MQKVSCLLACFIPLFIQSSRRSTFIVKPGTVLDTGELEINRTFWAQGYLKISKRRQRDSAVMRYTWYNLLNTV